jgi:hypothetical protein
VKAGSAAERVVVGPDVPPPVVVFSGVDGVLVAEELVFDCVPVCVFGVSGALETVTVFVPEPHAASSAAQPTPSAAAIVEDPVRVICRWYSPPARSIPQNIYIFISGC